MGESTCLINDKGEQIKTAGPSTPVEILGFTGVPDAGDLMGAVEHEARRVKSPNTVNASSVKNLPLVA